VVRRREKDEEIGGEILRKGLGWEAEKRKLQYACMAALACLGCFEDLVE